MLRQRLASRMPLQSSLPAAAAAAATAAADMQLSAQRLIALRGLQMIDNARCAASLTVLAFVHGLPELHPHLHTVRSDSRLAVDGV